RLLFEVCTALGRMVRCGEGLDDNAGVIELLQKVKAQTMDLGCRIPKAIDEAVHLLSDASLDPAEVSRTPEYSCAFGKGQQYMSFQKTSCD
ncbi:MAG: hypothetical protein V2A73_10560, partial [Pseudomonadota bacterium]